MEDAGPRTPQHSGRPPEWPAFLWHHSLHLHRGESLFFWRLGFSPSYDRDAVAAGLNAAADRSGVRSLMSYELFGAYDALIRVWLPESHSPDYFHATLMNELMTAGLEMCDPFAVSSVVRHWPFMGENEGEPTEGDVEAVLASEIEEIERDPHNAPPALVERLKRQHLLRVYEQGEAFSAIKFAVAIAGESDLPERKVLELTADVIRIVDGASSLEQRSLYAGSGFGHLLVIGRIPGERFHALHGQLLSQINIGAVREKYELRTMTLVSGHRGFHIAREGLAHPAEGVEEDVSQMVERALGNGREHFGRLAVDSIFAKRFQILEYLGGGGYAHVYHVFDMDEQVDRAIKIFPTEDPEAALRELRALRGIDHENIVKLFWYERAPGCCFLVNEFIEGCSLDRLEGVVEAQLALKIAAQILSALEYLHPKDQRIAELIAKGETTAMSVEELAELQRLQDHALIHRDIKPANIMLQPDGLVKIVDFNIASPADDLRGTIRHTPGYRPPDVDATLPRWRPDTDLFACGVVLYELICGVKPYPLQPEPDPRPLDPCELVSDLGSSVGKLLERACAATQAERFASANEMADAVHREMLQSNTVIGHLSDQAGAPGLPATLEGDIADDGLGSNGTLRQ